MDDAVLNEAIKSNALAFGFQDEIAKRLLNISSDPIVVTNQCGEIVYLNLQASNTFQRKLNDGIGRKISEIIPADYFSSTGLSGLVDQIQSGFISDVIHVDNFVKVKISPFQLEGKNYFAWFFSLTDLNNIDSLPFKNEIDLANVVIDNLPGILYIIDESLKYLRWNKNFEITSGYTGEEIKNISPIDFFPDSKKQKVKDAIELAFQSGFAEIEAEVLTSNGESFPYFFKARRIIYDGKPCILGTGVDLADQYQVQLELTKREKKYRSLFEQATDAILVTDFNGNIQDMNDSFCKMFKYSKDELLQINVQQLILEEDLLTNPIDFETLQAGGHIFNQRRVLNKDGRLFYIEANVKRFNENQFLIISRDVTEKRNIQLQIEENEFHFRKVTENEIIGIVWISPTGELIKANQAFYRMLGYEPDDLNNLHFSKFSHQDDVQVETNLFNEVLNGERDFYQIQKRFKTAIGGYIWTEVSQTCYRNADNNSVNFFIGILQNIHIKKQADSLIQESELRFRTIFESEPECVKIMDLEGRLLDMNPAGLALIEVDSVEQVRGHHVIGLVNPDYQPAFTKMLAEVVEGRNCQLEFEITGLKNTHRWMDMHAVPLFDQNKKITSILSVSRDITARKNAEEEVRSSREQLRNLSSHLQTIRENERTSIAREIHDELGQHLTSLKLDLSWINKKIPHDMPVLNDKIQEMIMLVDETVKSVRRISSELRPGILDDLGLIDAIDWQSTEFEKRTGIKSRFTSSVSHLSLDRTTTTGIFRVFQETLTNVTRHSGATQLKTNIECENGFFLLEVEDDGVGFDTFEIKSKLTLGLIGIRERATMLGGTISIESSPGMGTRVSLRVPLTSEMI